jgi:hypothetical protein
MLAIYCTHEAIAVGFLQLMEVLMLEQAAGLEVISK